MSTRPALAPPQHAALLAEALVFLLAVCFVVLGTQSGNLQDTANSRLATAWSLIHRGTWEISTPPGETPNPFERGTVDKVEIEGRRLSSKPPILPLLMAAEYWGMHHALGWRLDVPEDRARIVYWMTLTLVGSSYLLCLFFFARILHLFLDAPEVRACALFMLAFATQLPGLAADLNNHVPAAGLLMLSLYMALGVGSGKLSPHPLRLFCYGFTGALVFAIDMPMTVFVALAGLYLLWRVRTPAVIWGGLGMAAPLAVHFGVMLAVTGSPLPVQVRRALYLYHFSPWRNPGGEDALNEPKGLYLFHMTFGRNGLFLLFPVLLLGLLEGFRACFRPGPLRWQMLGGLLAFGILTAYYAKSTNNYGGASYGFRWYLGAMPVLLLMAAPMLARWRSLPAKALLAALLAVSMFSAWESYRMPWGSDHEWTCRWIYGPVYPRPEASDAAGDAPAATQALAPLLARLPQSSEGS